MSGIVCLFSAEGGSVGAISRLTSFLAYQGPDAQSTWSEDPDNLPQVGLGHALLRTTPESQNEAQPFSLDGQVRITADARVDDRSRLLVQLRQHGRHVADDAPDVELVLHAYHVWKSDCVQHLLGDFAFVIWDRPCQRLFCARDHLGVKTLYYARFGDLLVLSNNISCILEHPLARRTWNEQAIGDVLLFGGRSDPAATHYSSVCSLPPAHALTLSEGQVRVASYWRLEPTAEIRYSKPADYAEHFRELLEKAVADRLRTSKVGILMSGGMDSTSVAAIAHHVSKGNPRCDVRLWTFTFEKLVPFADSDYARRVADFLGLPIELVHLDHFEPYHRYQHEGYVPTSVDGPFQAAFMLRLQEMAGEGRVALMGHMGHLFVWPAEHYFAQLARDGRILRFLIDAYTSWQLAGRRPGLHFRRILLGWPGRPDPMEDFPQWLNSSFVRRLELRTRWKELHQEQYLSSHPLEAFFWRQTAVRPGGYEELDPGKTFAQLEMRLPLCDLRLLRYVLSIPQVPWGVNKHLLRQAMRGLLPESVRTQPKMVMPLQTVIRMHLQKDRSRWTELLRTTEGLSDYVDVSKAANFINSLQARSYSEAFMRLAPLTLAVWMRRQQPDDQTATDTFVSASSATGKGEGHTRYQPRGRPQPRPQR